MYKAAFQGDCSAMIISYIYVTFRYHFTAHGLLLAVHCLFDSEGFEPEASRTGVFYALFNEPRARKLVNYLIDLITRQISHVYKKYSQTVVNHLFMGHCPYLQFNCLTSSIRYSFITHRGFIA